MKPAHTFSFFRTTSDIFASSQRKDSATFCSTSFLSLSLLRDSRRRELLPDWTIDDATPGSICMTPGHSSTPPSLAIRFSSSVLQRTSIEIPRPASREAWTLLELSFGYITRESRQSSSFPILNQPDSRTQQVSFVPARFLRIGKILRISRLPYTTDSRHGFSSIEPQPFTVRHNFGPSVVCSSSRQGTLRTFAGSWAVIHGLRALCLVVLV